MTFDWDDGNRDKCSKHGMTAHEIEHVLSHRPLVAPDGKHSSAEQRLVAVGRTAEGRPAFVVFCWRGDRMRPVSARFMHAREARRYDLAQDRSGDDHG